VSVFTISEKSICLLTVVSALHWSHRQYFNKGAIHNIFLTEGKNLIVDKQNHKYIESNI